MTHTPGPWVLKDDHLTSQVLVTGGTTRIVRFGPRENWDAVDYANAQLLAAAPDMLEALEAQAKFDLHCVHCDRCGRAPKYCDSGWQLWNTAGNLRNQAIAKAKGRPPKEKD